MPGPARLALPVALLALACGFASCASVTAKPAPDEAAAAPSAVRVDGPVRILVAYHSRSGNTEQMAQAVAEGVHRVPGTVAVVEKVEAVEKADLEAADGLVLGAPTYFADMSGTMKLAIDDWNWKMKVDFTDKVSGAFSTGGGQSGGKEHVIVSLLLFMINNRMVVAGPLYQDADGDDKWAELGASAMTGPLDPGVSDQERTAARLLGQRIARLAHKMPRH